MILLPLPAAQPVSVLRAAELRLWASPAAFEMEFALATTSERRQVAKPRPVALAGEERAARWRLELAETRTHPFQLEKFFPAAPAA